MAKTILKTSLDVGSSQVVAVIGKQDAETGELTILGAAVEPCRGLKGGLVTNIAETKLSVNKAVEQAESQANETVEDLFVAVRGSHVETFNHRGAITLSRTDKEITAEDVDQVLTNAKAIQVSADREILHAAPQDFSVDKQSGVRDPIGMDGSHLSVDVHIAAASSHPINNIVKAINLAGFNCAELVYGAYALGDAIISQEEKELGVAMIDIGGQTTQIVIYIEGSIRYTKEMPIGGELITKDIAYGLKTSFAQAEYLKEKYGFSHISQLQSDEKICSLANWRAQIQDKARNIDEHKGLIEYMNDPKHWQELSLTAIGENASYGYVLSGVHLIEWVFDADTEHRDNQLNPNWTLACAGISGVTVDIIFGKR